MTVTAPDEIRALAFVVHQLRPSREPGTITARLASEHASGRAFAEIALDAIMRAIDDGPEQMPLDVRVLAWTIGRLRPKWSRRLINQHLVAAAIARPTDELILSAIDAALTPKLREVAVLSTHRARTGDGPTECPECQARAIRTRANRPPKCPRCKRDMWPGYEHTCPDPGEKDLSWLKPYLAAGKVINDRIRQLKNDSKRTGVDHRAEIAQLESDRADRQGALTRAEAIRADWGTA